MKRYFFLTLLFLSWLFGHAQNATITENWIKQCMDLILENQTTEIDQSDLELTIREWINQPIKLNTADRTTLSKLFFLNPKDIDVILNHRKNYGPFLSIYELQSVEGLDQQTAKLLSHFFTVNETKTSDYYSIPLLLKKGDHEVIWKGARTLQTTKAYQNNNIYAGNPAHISFRYRFVYSHKLYLGFGIEKDPGEKWNKAGDFQTFHFLYKGKGFLRTLALGDFHFNMGKGLCMGTSMFNGKSSLVMQSQLYGDGIKPYRSLNESGFLRGIGIELNKNNLTFSAFISAKQITAMVTRDTLFNQDMIESIAVNGLHRTNSEIAKKNEAWQKVLGTQIKYDNKKIHLGLNYAKKEEGKSLMNKADLQKLANPLLNYTLSLDGIVNFKNIILSGEIAKSNTNQLAYILHSLMPLSSKLDLMLIYRDYGIHFENNLSNAWSAQSSIGNEQGLYTAFSYKPKRNQQFNCYLDIFKSPMARYQASLPSRGSDYFIDYGYAYSKSLSINLRWRLQQKEQDLPEENSISKQLVNTMRNQFRLHLNYQISPNWQYQTRYEKIIAQKTDQKKYQGNMVYHDISYHPKGKKWNIRSRICLFQIEDYAARIYVQEGDVLYSYAQSQLIESGVRLNGIGSYHLTKKIAIQIRLAHTFLSQAKTIGSGWDEIEGNQKTDVKFQLIMKW